MQHYGVNDVRDGGQKEKHVDHILKKYPELLISLNCIKTYDSSKFKGDRRILRRDVERIKRYNRKTRKLPSLRVKQFESALFDAMNDSRDISLFSCPICRNILTGPVTVDCGHTFCIGCLNTVNYDNCVICSTEITNSGCINILVQDLLEKWRERNKTNSIDGVPNTGDILGIQPRYHLRSGFAGLRMIVDDIENQELLRMEETNKYFHRLSAKREMSDKKFDLTIKTVFKEVEDIKDKALRNCWNSIQSTDVECILCGHCILDPITTACGHTFCRGCLTRVLDHGLSCPLCMASLSVKDYSRGCSVVLDQAVRFLLPKDYNQRLLSTLKEAQMLGKNAEIPVFICTNAFPSVACPLYVFEPRYRLLIRRCLLSSNRRFAMAAKESNGDKFVSYGTVLEVKDSVSLEDGSFILTTVGVRRFKVVSRGEQDGYDTAKIQVIKDAAVSSEKQAELEVLHQKVYNKASKWILSLTSKVLAEVERLIGKMPPVERNWFSLPDGPSWTWWLMPILPLSSQLQVGFLSTLDLEKRLRAIDKMLERMEIRMKSLEANTVDYPPLVDDSCGETERAFEIPFPH